MEKYLIELLETNNRVIVPDLGAFIIRQQEPRELVFNDLLAFNDGMLTAHIKQEEGISMSKAQVKIEAFVDQVKKVLTKGDIFHLENLGYLKMDDSSKIEFSVTKFPSVRAEVISAATLSQQEEDSKESPVEPEQETPEEMPEPAEEEAREEEVLEEVPEEESPVPEVPEEDGLKAESPEEEPEDEEAVEWAVDEGDIPEAEAVPEEEPDEKVTHAATDDGSFTLEDQPPEMEADASEEKPLIPQPEESPFMVEEQEKQEEQTATVVGTSQARLEAAAMAAANDEKKAAEESEQESDSTTETSIPYYVDQERRTMRIWPWIGGAAALLIILFVAAWFFFPDEINRIFGEKSADIVATEEATTEEPADLSPETESGRQEETIAQTESDQGETPAETDAPGKETGEDASREPDADQSGEESVEETVSESEPEPESVSPPAGRIKKYYIVAGMFASRTNAEDFVNTLKARGYDAELFGRKNNLYGVSFSSHESRADAVQEMNRIREEYNPKAWLLYY
jgi:cell division septation protein DedD/nucleoid DNA-binding protein